MRKILLNVSLIFCFTLVAFDTVLASDKLKELNEIENLELRDEILESNTACWIVLTICLDCNAGVYSQYCDEGLHGTPEEWDTNLCRQLCSRLQEDQDPE